MGLPVKSLLSISSTRIRFQDEKPLVPFQLIYGERDANRPDDIWANKIDVEMDVIPNYGHTLYTDEKIIRKVCLALLKEVTSINIPRKN
ncbi:hypothetical protein NYZ99_03435 [Maribacter litopenaei]|uniref:Alpha/beta hydrolase family protein n=1 Tax=Maribacter litopenaei TaxID=2976127 RepID=A0ABY5Y935_9FLAO|nr:hypothetical protein [Maribacter litopenaei]UWX55557.1 hypothetical protein NYZ99_03435 [Maribacter litopenaei]